MFLFSDEHSCFTRKQKRIPRENKLCTKQQWKKNKKQQEADKKTKTHASSVSWQQLQHQKKKKQQSVWVIINRLWAAITDYPWCGTGGFSVCVWWTNQISCFYCWIMTTRVLCGVNKRLLRPELFRGLFQRNIRINFQRQFSDLFVLVLRSTFVSAQTRSFVFRWSNSSKSQSTTESTPSTGKH